MRVVLDSNVVIFTLLFGGKAAVVVGGMSLERVTLVMTEAILIEIAWVLRIRLGLSPDRILSTQDDIRRRAEMVLRGLKRVSVSLRTITGFLRRPLLVGGLYCEWG